MVDAIRVTIRTPEQNKRFFECFKSLYVKEGQMEFKTLLNQIATLLQNLTLRQRIVAAVSIVALIGFSILDTV